MSKIRHAYYLILLQESDKMVDKILVILLMISILFSVVLNKTSELSEALIKSSNMAVKTVINLIGSMALWGGVMQVAKSAGITDKICRLFKYPVRVLFPDIKKDSSIAQLISMNITANLLGLGNAATPIGISAMKELKRQNCSAKSMATLVVINASSIQLIPITVAALRLSNGSESPWDFVPSVLIVSIIALTAGIIMVKALYFDKKMV